MAYQANAVPVMIASPSDVTRYREVIRNELNRWNYVHSLETNTVLIPVGWETHSSPELGARPQELINNRLLKDCDLLIAVFWTRLGTPTGMADSGTVEEIEEHLKAKKPAMVYFSSEPVAPQSIDHDQYNALTAFLVKMRALGLVENFTDLNDFREKFNAQLQITMYQNEYLRDIVHRKKQIGDVNDVGSNTEKSFKRRVSVSSDAIELLKSASEDGQGQILKLAAIGGRMIQAGKMTYGEGSPREASRWEAALSELINEKLVESLGHKGQIYSVTHSGWKLVETLG